MYSDYKLAYYLTVLTLKQSIRSIKIMHRKSWNLLRVNYKNEMKFILADLVGVWTMAKGKVPFSCCLDRSLCICQVFYKYVYLYWS